MLDRFPALGQQRLVGLEHVEHARPDFELHHDSVGTRLLRHAAHCRREASRAPRPESTAVAGRGSRRIRVKPGGREDPSAPDSERRNTGMVLELMIGSLTVRNESLASVKSVTGEMAIAPAGSGRPRSRRASSAARVRLPPAESPAMKVAVAGADPPVHSRAATRARIQSSSPPGKGCSGA